MDDSPAVILFNTNGIELAVSGGIAVPISTSALLFAGIDTNGTASIPRVDNNGNLFVSGTTVISNFPATQSVIIQNTASINITNALLPVSVSNLPILQTITGTVGIINTPTVDIIPTKSTASILYSGSLAANGAYSSSLAFDTTYYSSVELFFAYTTPSATGSFAAYIQKIANNNWYDMSIINGNMFVPSNNQSYDIGFNRLNLVSPNGINSNLTFEFDCSKTTQIRILCKESGSIVGIGTSGSLVITAIGAR